MVCCCGSHLSSHCIDCSYNYFVLVPEQISYIFYDGVVPFVESDEYTTIKNMGATSVHIAGWRLNASGPGQDYNFPDYTMQAGQDCRVYTNEIHPESCDFSFGSSVALWKNSGDCGYWYDEGTQIDEYCYP